MTPGFLSLVVPLAITCLLLTAGAAVGAVAWATAVDAIDGETSTVFALLDGRAIGAGLVSGLIATLVAATILDRIWNALSRRLPRQ